MNLALKTIGFTVFALSLSALNFNIDSSGIHYAAVQAKKVDGDEKAKDTVRGEGSCHASDKAHDHSSDKSAVHQCGDHKDKKKSHKHSDSHGHMKDHSSKQCHASDKAHGRSSDKSAAHHCGDREDMGKDHKHGDGHDHKMDVPKK